MTKNESKYFNTAEKMDKAFLEILGKKDFEYITVKEICAEAGVNRSTFYLHYETVADLLSESVEYITRNFLDGINQEAGEFISKIQTCPRDELFLITPKYLVPYLEYVRDNRKLFMIALENAGSLELHNSYKGLFQYVIEPVLDRFDVPKRERNYIVMFYIKGIMSIVEKWISDGCRDEIDFISEIIMKCVAKPNN